MTLWAIGRLLASQQAQRRHWLYPCICTASYLRQAQLNGEAINISRAYTTSSSDAFGSLANDQTVCNASLQLSQQLHDASAFTTFAAQPLEPLWQLLNPVVLGSSAWELVHSSTGLPWWASIPLTTLALRAALSPLTIKAKSAGLNWVLLQNAFQTADRLLDQMQQQQDSAPVQQQQQQQIDRMQRLKKPQKLKLVRLYYRYLRKQHKTTSMWWWTANAVLQVNVFIVMSAVLRNMSAVQWPGFTSEGIAWFPDLTQPAAVWSTLQCPYGVAGIGLPFLILGLYKYTIDRSPAVLNPNLETLLLSGTVPLFIISSAVPHAMLLYWLGNSVFFFGMQEALKQPKIARALGIPPAMMPPPRGAKEESERAEQEDADAAALCGSEDDGFLRFLASYYLDRRKHQLAMQCLQRLTVLAPGDGHAYSALGQTAAELQKWPVAAAAYQRSAELCAAAGDQDEQATELVLAGKHWLNAVAEARHMRKTAAATASRSSSTQVRGSAMAADVPADLQAISSTSAVHDDRQQEYLDSALLVLQSAVALSSSSAADGWRLLATAQAAGNRLADALHSSQTYWSKACVDAEKDPLAKSNAAVKLLPVLASIAGKCQVPQDEQSLLQAAALGAEAAEAGWDRQSHEKLQRVLDAAAQAASQQGRFELAEKFKQLKAKLQTIDSDMSKLRMR